MHAHHHDDHAHDHSHGPSSSKVLIIGLFITGGFAAVELVTGWLAGSLALMADAGHMVTDSAALGLGAIAAALSRRPPSLRHTFGLRRAEILGALANAVFLVLVVVWIVVEAVERLINPVDVQAQWVLVVAVIGFVVNVVVLRVLHGGEQNLNTRAAMLHVLGDLLGSVAAIASGLIILFTGWTVADPLLSLLISALILISTWRLLREALRVVMEGVPEHIDLQRVGHRLAGLEGVRNVHDLHVWSIGSAGTVLTAHVTLSTLDYWPERLKHMETLLYQEFGIDHVTLQPEVPYRVDLVPPDSLRRNGVSPST